PEELVAAGLGRADHPHRGALGEGAERAEKADRYADLGAVGDHHLDGFTAALGVQNIEREPMLLEEAGVLAELSDKGLAHPAGANRDLEMVLGARRRGQ